MVILNTLDTSALSVTGPKISVTASPASGSESDPLSECFYSPDALTSHLEPRVEFVDHVLGVAERFRGSNGEVFLVCVRIAVYVWIRVCVPKRMHG